MPRTTAKFVALLSAFGCALACPLSAGAVTGGQASTAPTPTPTGAPAPTPASAPTSPTASTVPPVLTSAGALTLRTSSTALLGGVLTFTGTTPRRDARHTLQIERLEASTGAWVVATSTRVNKRGGFVAHWRTNLPGRVTVRAVVGPAAAPARAASTDSTPPAEITIYLPALASYYGPGFYGKQTACGQTLTPLTIGTASRTLPCGTLVEVSYEGRSLTVPVIDRGPYANGASWDLTQAAAESLGITETVKIGTLISGATENTPTLGLPPGALAAEAAAAQTGGSIS